MNTNRIDGIRMIGTLELSLDDLEQVVGGKGATVQGSPNPPGSASLTTTTLGHLLGAPLSGPPVADPVLAHVLGVDPATHGKDETHHATGSPVWNLFGGGQK